MTNFEKAQSKLMSLIRQHEYNVYMDKCLVEAYKRYCKKYPTSEFYFQGLQSYKSSYRQHKQALKDLSEIQDLLKGQKHLCIVLDIEVE